MRFTEQELQLIETSLRGSLERFGGVHDELEQLIEKIAGRGNKA